MQTLEERREELLLNFALKTQKNERFSDDWFPTRTDSNYPLRNRRNFIEVKARTERQKKNPVFYMRKALNNYFAKLA